MRPVHVYGVGLVVGMTALGALLAAMTLGWAEANFPLEKAAGGGKSVTASEGQIPPEAAQGRTIFNQKCNSCHTIGQGNRTGPDLKGVTDRQPEDWVIRFIVEPDKVLASGDPAAQELLKQYNNVPMPNLGVTQEQAQQVVAYIKYQSGGSTTPPKGTPPAAAGGAAPKPGATAGAAQASPGGAQPKPAATAEGAAVFNQNCNGCHPGGDKGAGPALKGKNLPADRVRTIVRNGGNGMPPYNQSQISDQQLAALVEYVQGLK